MKLLIKSFKKEGISLLKTLSEDDLSLLLNESNDAYYVNNKPLLTDNQYDLLREYVLREYPNNIVAKEGHKNVEINVMKNKVNLPYEMWSMNKIKPDTNALSKWIKKYSGPYVLSCKLDGVSALYSTMGKEAKLYTRGNGTIGQDISHFIPYFKLPKNKNIVVRGEIIVKKEKFDNKYKKDFANPRNFVAGVINQKKINTKTVKDLDFVSYELIEPSLSPLEQMERLQTMDIIVVQYLSIQSKKLSNELLSELLVKWRDEYEYEIDGVICCNNKIYKRDRGNPKHAFAFKMVIGDQIAEAKVVNVIWSPSKDGYLKPRVQIEPITLDGVKIEYATGFNAKFIKDNKIGVGSVIKLMRSGQVIPHIISVEVPSDEAMMPLMSKDKYEWNETGVDIILRDTDVNRKVREKKITYFFEKIGVEGLGSGNIKRIMNAGYETIPEIISMNVNDFLKVEGFKEKMANKIYNGIKDKLEEVSLPDLMSSSNIFGRGLGEKKIKLILNEYPDILVSKESEKEKIDKIKNIDGLAIKTSTQFVSNIPEFLEWFKKTKLSKDRLKYKTLNNLKRENSKKEKHELYEKKIVLTGFRDKSLLKKLEEVGAVHTNSVSKNTYALIVKEDINEDTGKADKARKLGIPIITLEDFKKKYGL